MILHVLFLGHSNCESIRWYGETIKSKQYGKWLQYMENSNPAQFPRSAKDFV